MGASTKTGLLTLIGVLFIVLATAFFIPAAQFAADGVGPANQERQTIQFDLGEKKILYQNLSVILTDIDYPNNTVNATVIETGVLTRNEVTDLSIGSPQTVTPYKSDVLVVLIEVSSPSTATLAFSYNKFYGWRTSAVTLFENIWAIWLLIGILFIVGSVLLMGGWNNGR